LGDAVGDHDVVGGAGSVLPGGDCLGYGFPEIFVAVGFSVAEAPICANSLHGFPDLGGDLEVGVCGCEGYHVGGEGAPSVAGVFPEKSEGEGFVAEGGHGGYLERLSDKTRGGFHGVLGL